MFIWQEAFPYGDHLAYSEHGLELLAWLIILNEAPLEVKISLGIHKFIKII